MAAVSEIEVVTDAPAPAVHVAPARPVNRFYAQAAKLEAHQAVKLKREETPSPFSRVTVESPRGTVTTPDGMHVRGSGLADELVGRPPPGAPEGGVWEDASFWGEKTVRALRRSCPRLCVTTERAPARAVAPLRRAAALLPAPALCRRALLLEARQAHRLRRRAARADRPRHAHRVRRGRQRGRRMRRAAVGRVAVVMVRYSQRAAA